MRVVKPQPVLASFSPTQWGNQAQMCIAIGVGFRLSDPRVLAHEAAVWEALRAVPTVAPMSETGMPKQFAEWLLVGHTQCAFSISELGMLRDWTAQVGLGKTVKKISAKTKVTQDHQGHALGFLSVDHSESIQGFKAANPVGHEGAFAPLQILTWHGPKSQALAGMTPVDARWPERRQWMPRFASSLEGMALDGSHMGWPKDTDKRYFQQAAPDQWGDDLVWPQGASYELRGFGAAGCGFEGSLPKLDPQVLVVGRDKNQSVALMQQTVWFLPDQDLAVMWWTGSVNLMHPLDDSLSMMIVALHEAGGISKANELLHYAIRRTNVKVPDLSAQSDLPLLPALAGGWAWEQILSAAQHPRDRRTHLSYEQLREQIVEEENRMAQAHSQMNPLAQSSLSPARIVSPTPTVAYDPKAWKFKWKEASNKQLSDESFKHQDFRGCDWAGWTLKNVRFESCVMDGCSWSDGVFDNVEILNTSFHQARWRNITWTQGAMERCKADQAMWQNLSLSHVRMVQCELKAHQVTGGQWRHVLMDEVEWLSASWGQLLTESMVVMKSQLQGLRVRESTLDKLSMIESDASQSHWVLSRFSKASLVEGSNLDGSFWQDCDFTNTCWIGLMARDARIEHCSFKNFNAQGALLSRSAWFFCNLNDAQFLNADLRDSSFESTSLRGALMSGALLQNSRVKYSNLIRVNTSNAVRTSPEHWHNNLTGGALMHPQKFA